MTRRTIFLKTLLALLVVSCLGLIVRVYLSQTGSGLGWARAVGGEIPYGERRSHNPTMDEWRRKFSLNPMEVPQGDSGDDSSQRGDHKKSSYLSNLSGPEDTSHNNDVKTMNGQIIRDVKNAEHDVTDSKVGSSHVNNRVSNRTTTRNSIDGVVLRNSREGNVTDESVISVNSSRFTMKSQTEQVLKDKIPHISLDNSSEQIFPDRETPPNSAHSQAEQGLKDKIPRISSDKSSEQTFPERETSPNSAQSQAEQGLKDKIPRISSDNSSEQTFSERETLSNSPHSQAEQGLKGKIPDISSDNLSKQTSQAREAPSDVTPEETSPTFRHINRLGVYSFPSVCIERTRYPTPASIKLKSGVYSFNQTMKIVVYNSSRDGHLHLDVSGSPNSLWNHWELVQSRAPLPPAVTHTRLRGVVGYFISPTCPGNLHHFWEDEFRVLMSVVRASGRLHRGATNRLLYRFPWDLDPSDLACNDVRTYKPLLNSLYFDDFNDVYYKVGDNVCFDYGVFGNTDIDSQRRDAVDHVTREFNISRDTCPDNVLTFIDRSYRKLLNTGELVAVAKEEGFHNVQVVQMETLGVVAQARVAACTSVLIGIQGAGLQWAVFMAPGSAVIEVAWPVKHWGFFFKTFLPRYDVAVREIATRRLRLNWVEYQNRARGGAVISDDERNKLMYYRPRVASFDNPWKYVDVLVDTEYFRFALKSVLFGRRAKKPF